MINPLRTTPPSAPLDKSISLSRGYRVYFTITYNYLSQIPYWRIHRGESDMWRLVSLGTYCKCSYYGYPGMNELTQFLETVLTHSCLDIRNKDIRLPIPLTQKYPDIKSLDTFIFFHISTPVISNN